MERLERKDVLGRSLAQNMISDPPAHGPNKNTVSISREEYNRLKECEKQLETIKTVLGSGGSGSFSQGKRKVDEGKGSQKGKRRGGWNAF